MSVRNILICTCTFRFTKKTIAIQFDLCQKVDSNWFVRFVQTDTLCARKPSCWSYDRPTECWLLTTSCGNRSFGGSILSVWCQCRQYRVYRQLELANFALQTPNKLRSNRKSPIFGGRRGGVTKSIRQVNQNRKGSNRELECTTSSRLP